MDAEATLDAWADRTGEYSPAYYAYYGPDDTSERLRSVLEEHVGRDASVLELGCSAGRHLAHLHEHGYDDLAGVDVNPDALDALRANYPDLARAGTVHLEAIEAVLPTLSDGAFDAVFAVETLQHVHADNSWVFAEVARVASEVVVTVEVESPYQGPDAEGAAGENRRGARGGTDGAPDPRGDDVTSTVSYVDDAFPLYYRDWGEVFTALGYEQVAVEDLERDTLRVFRAVES